MEPFLYNDNNNIVVIFRIKEYVLPNIALGGMSKKILMEWLGRGVWNDFSYKGFDKFVAIN